MGFPVSVAVEAENANDSTTMFRLRIDGEMVGENLTAAQAHLLVGDVLERIVLPKKERASPKAGPGAAAFGLKSYNQANADPRPATVDIALKPSALVPWSRISASAQALPRRVASLWRRTLPSIARRPRPIAVLSQISAGFLIRGRRSGA